MFDLINKAYLKLLVMCWSVVVPWRLRSMGVTIGCNVKFYGMPIVTLTKGSSIIIRDRSVLCSDSRFTALGVNRPVILRTLRVGACIDIGPDVGISGGVLCSAESIAIGAGSMLGANVEIFDTDFHPVSHQNRRYEKIDAAATKAVLVGKNVFIGSSAIIQKGVEIGDNSVVGAASVVVRGVKPNVIVAGIPARIIGDVNL